MFRWIFVQLSSRAVVLLKPSFRGLFVGVEPVGFTIYHILG